jgi:F1F0 ATPase subunit 2
MSGSPDLFMAWAVGGLLGAIFFGGLWWTVRRGMESSQPGLWFFGSMLVRTAVVLAGFYLVADGQLARLLLCLLGFVTAKLAVMRLTRSAPGATDMPQREAGHAP